MSELKKNCPGCNTEKNITDFYSTARTCKECVRKRTSAREKKLRETNPDWVEKEKERGREKYHRLGCKKPSSEKKAETIRRHKEKYPEKYYAKIASQRMPKEKEHRHHWSYNDKHFKDIIHLTNEEHSLLHRFMVYDQERKMYRNLKGVLLDSKDSHTSLLSTLTK